MDLRALGSVCLSLFSVLYGFYVFRELLLGLWSWNLFFFNFATFLIHYIIGGRLWFIIIIPVKSECSIWGFLQR
jgi:hypothetical protein